MEFMMLSYNVITENYLTPSMLMTQIRAKSKAIFVSFYFYLKQQNF